MLNSYISTFPNLIQTLHSKILENPGNPWKSLEIPGNLWKSLEISGIAIVCAIYF
jgi:hypothetical protein